MFGTKVNESDGRFLEKLDGLDYDSLFIFEDLAYGFIPNEAGAAFGIAQMDRIEELWELEILDLIAIINFLKIIKISLSFLKH